MIPALFLVSLCGLVTFGIGYACMCKHRHEIIRRGPAGEFGWECTNCFRWRPIVIERSAIGKRFVRRAWKPKAKRPSISKQELERMAK